MRVACVKMLVYIMTNEWDFVMVSSIMDVSYRNIEVS